MKISTLIHSAIVATVFAPGGAALAGSPGAAAGAKVYERACVACHGTDGVGAMPGIPDFCILGGPLDKPDNALLASIIMIRQNI